VTGRVCRHALFISTGEVRQTTSAKPFFGNNFFQKKLPDLLSRFDAAAANFFKRKYGSRFPGESDA
jgi:hypothetical protein